MTNLRNKFLAMKETFEAAEAAQERQKRFEEDEAVKKCVLNIVDYFEKCAKTGHIPWLKGQVYFYVPARLADRVLTDFESSSGLKGNVVHSSMDSKLFVENPFDKQTNT